MKGVEDGGGQVLTADDLGLGKLRRVPSAPGEGAVQGSQWRPGFDVELVAQSAAHLQVGLDGVPVPAAVAQGADEQHGQLLVETVLAGEEVDDLAGSPVLEQQLGVADGEGASALLGVATGVGKPVRVEAGDWRAAPGLLGLVVRVEVVAAQRGVSEVVEAEEVDGVLGEVQRVQAASGRDPGFGTLPQSGAEAGQGDLQGTSGVLGRFSPQASSMSRSPSTGWQAFMASIPRIAPWFRLRRSSATRSRSTATAPSRRI
nr:hypothetical protein [Actinomycetospora sp. TBRC 11914]